MSPSGLSTALSRSGLRLPHSSELPPPSPRSGYFPPTAVIAQFVADCTYEAVPQHAVKSCVSVTALRHLLNFGDEHRDGFGFELYSCVDPEVFGDFSWGRTEVVVQGCREILIFLFLQFFRVSHFRERLRKYWPMIDRKIHFFVSSSSTPFALKNAPSHYVYDNQGSLLPYSFTLPNVAISIVSASARKFA